MTHLKPLNEGLIAEIIKQAHQSPRRRANFNFHRENESLQRMVNVMLHGTYCAPHKHENPDKLEIFTALRGEVAIVRFDDDGNITESVRISQLGPLYQVEIPPRTWHTVVVLSEVAVLYEIIDGHYDPATHKRFAPFAPGEKSPDANRYLVELQNRLASHTE